MVITGVDRRPFNEGDEVMLNNGTYTGTMGVFIRLKDDANWADIKEKNGTVRSHPVIWLMHRVTKPDPASKGVRGPGSASFTMRDPDSKGA